MVKWEHDDQALKLRTQPVFRCGRRLLFSHMFRAFDPAPQGAALFTNSQYAKSDLQRAL